MDAAADRATIEDRTRKAIDGALTERFNTRPTPAIRVAFIPGDEGVSFAGLLPPESPPSGVYGGMSLCWFPIAGNGDERATSLLTFVCGTRGLAPDEQTLGRPGHARILNAMRRYLGKRFRIPVWTKNDPTDLSQQFPQTIKQELPGFEQVLSRYGNYIYAAARVPAETDRAQALVAAFLDAYARERGWLPRATARDEFNSYQDQLRAFSFERLSQPEVNKLLQERRFVVLQGPPGTGKTRLAQSLLENEFSGKGTIVQFHPAVTYETFVGGIAPDVQHKELRFELRSGWLVEAIRAAKDGPYLLVVDEINRADLSRVLGEAIYLFEPREIAQGKSREVRLPHPLDDGTSTLSIPINLYVIGTMNTADRSTAILDQAVRRRFAFVDVWPDASVIAEQNIDLATDAFGRLQDIFIEYAPADALNLLPGHAYFLAGSIEELGRRLRYELMPLLREYLVEGRLGQCESELRAYLNWLESRMPSGAHA